MVPPEPDLDLDLIKVVVDSAIDAELLQLQTEHAAGREHMVSGESIYSLLMKNMEGKWMQAYIGPEADAVPKLTAAIIKRLQVHTGAGSKDQSRLEAKLKGLDALDVPTLFIGQRVWARWLGTQNRVEGGWYKARMLREGAEKIGRARERTHVLYYDSDQGVHHKMPLKKQRHEVISTAQRPQ